MAARIERGQMKSFWKIRRKDGQFATPGAGWASVGRTWSRRGDAVSHVSCNIERYMHATEVELVEYAVTEVASVPISVVVTDITIAQAEAEEKKAKTHESYERREFERLKKKFSGD